MGPVEVVLVTDLLPVVETEDQVSIPERDHIPCCRDFDKALCGLSLVGAPFTGPNYSDADLCPLCDIAREDPHYCPKLSRCMGFSADD